MFQQCHLRNGLHALHRPRRHELFYRGRVRSTSPGFLRETLRSLQDDYYARFAPFVSCSTE